MLRLLRHPSTMSNVHRLLPRLTVNRRLLQAVVDESRPCCALGFVEERKQRRAAIVLGLPQIENLHELGDGFRLGHQVAFIGKVCALRLDFWFERLTPLQVVLDPANDTVHCVIGAIVQSDAYFVLIVGAHGLTAFRADTKREERHRFGEVLREAAEPAGQQARFSALEQALSDVSPARTPLVWLGASDPGLLELSGAQAYELRPSG